MAEEKRPKLTEEDCRLALESVNLIFNAAMNNLPTGLVPAAQEAQSKAIQAAGQELVNLIQKNGPPVAVDE